MVSISDILEFLKEEEIDYSYSGEDVSVEGFSSVSNYKNGTCTWIKKQECLPVKEMIAKMTLVIAEADIDIDSSNVIFSKESKRAFFSIIDHFWGGEKEEDNIGKNVYISPEVHLGKNVVIGHNCSIDGRVTIGDNTRIWNNVVIINDVKIGTNCEIESGVVIGHDGFGYTEDALHVKTMIKHYGGVEVKNNVHIGAHTNIARGTIDNTVIGNGVKIAPSTHIGHNTVIGDNSTVICSQLYGSVIAGENSYIVGSIVKNQSSIGKDTMIGMGSVVTNSIGSNIVAVGAPAKEIRDRY